MKVQYSTITFFLTMLLMVVALAGGIVVGILYEQEQVIEKPVPVPEPYEVITYVDSPVYEVVEKLVYIDRERIIEREVVREVEVEKPVAVPMTEWRDFENSVELADWLENLSVLWITGKVADCDDYSEYVWDMAYKDGYRMSEVCVYNGVYCGRRVSDVGGWHIGCQVQIKNSYYYFDPNPLNYRIIYIIDRD